MRSLSRSFFFIAPKQHLMSFPLFSEPWASRFAVTAWAWGQTCIRTPPRWPKKWAYALLTSNCNHDQLLWSAMRPLNHRSLWRRWKERASSAEKSTLRAPSGNSFPRLVSREILHFKKFGRKRMEPARRVRSPATLCEARRPSRRRQPPSPTGHFWGIAACFTQKGEPCGSPFGCVSDSFRLWA